MLTLNNGANVLAVKPSKDGYIVMAIFNKSYVTWFINKYKDAYWGHYYDNEKDAIIDFNNRH